MTLADALVRELSDDALAVLAERLRPWLAPSPAPEPDGWLTTAGAAAYLGLSVGALHRLTAARRVPFEQDAPGAKCWFRRSELDRWRRGGGAR